MRFFKYIFLFFFISSFAQSRKFKVVLDAGHGGKDPGKIFGKVNEKQIALKIILLVGKELEKDSRFSVVYTRKDDRFIELYERGAIANREKAQLFISVHCNGAAATKAYGSETFVLGLHANERNFEVAKEENQVIYLENNYHEKYSGYDINSPESFIGLSIMQEEFLEQSIQLAKFVQNNLTTENKRKDRGVKQAGFIVLHQTYMPSILIETGFLSNTEEREYLTSQKGQQEIATSIVKAVKSYYEWIKNNSSESTKIAEAIKENKTDSSKIVQKTTTQNIYYKIQLATSNRNLDTKPSNFKGLKPISKEPIDNLYRYYFGKENNLKKAEQLQQDAKKKGYKDAFIVPFVDGKRSTMEELQK